MGITLGAIGASFSLAAAVEQCGTGGVNRDCWIQLAAAVININTVGLSATIPASVRNEILAHLGGLAADLLGQAAAFLSDDTFHALQHVAGRC